MKMTCFQLLTRGMTHCQNSTGTISAMSQRKPSTPRAIQKRRMASILCHVSGTG